jgi:hypothetical protein
MPDLVNSRERVLYALVVIVSLVTYAVIGLVVLAQPEFAISVAFYGALFAVAAFFAQGHTIGRLRGNAIRAGERQFPLLHRTVQEHARRLGLGRAPEVYVVESSGLLNAFATRFLGRDFVVIHSDVLELAMAEGEPAVSFILAHELGHVWRGHLKRRWLTAPDGSPPTSAPPIRAPASTPATVWEPIADRTAPFRACWCSPPASNCTTWSMRASSPPRRKPSADSGFAAGSSGLRTPTCPSESRRSCARERRSRCPPGRQVPGPPERARPLRPRATG